MYKIVNYEKWWCYDKIFYSFKDAFNIYELKGFEEDENNIIVNVTDKEKIVYNPKWIENGQDQYLQ